MRERHARARNGWPSATSFTSSMSRCRRRRVPRRGRRPAVKTLGAELIAIPPAARTWNPRNRRAVTATRARRITSALAQAHVGMAMGTATDLAMESAGVTLVKGDLRGIVRARRLEPRHRAQHPSELFFAFVYNSLGVPLAAGILYRFLPAALADRRWAVACHSARLPFLPGDGSCLHCCGLVPSSSCSSPVNFRL